MADSLTFVVLPPGHAPAPGLANTAVLSPSGWDDWFVFETQFTLVIYDQAAVRHEIGALKVGWAGMAGHREPVPSDMLWHRKTQLPPSPFALLPDGYFSLGQDESYYLRLNAMGGILRDAVLVALRDVAFDQNLFEARVGEYVMGRSLLRFVTAATVRGQFARVARGGARLTPFQFQYQLHRRGGAGPPPPLLTFEVVPESKPPSNVHVIIGRNGVGKTDLFSNMTRAFLGDSTLGRRDFACIVSVSFSAFDSFELLPERRDPAVTPRFAYVGLRRASNRGDAQGTPKSAEMLAGEFLAAMAVSRSGARGARWRQALDSLEHDPIFHDAGVAGWGAEGSDEGDKATIGLFRRLSSGHKIVLLTITKLVELVEEKTLVLIDEPEAHLHPPLLSAFVRALSDLLVARNGVAVIATHSPVVLQEVPKSCVWKLFRVGAECRAERPEIETFGENVGVLTREAFGLEVTKTGFHQLIAAEVEAGGTYEEVVGRFGGRLGAEALAMVRALVSLREATP